MIRALSILMLFAFCCGFIIWKPTGPAVSSEPRVKLSDYRFFSGQLAEHHPQAGVIPYHLNTPLFSDYAEKLRFVKVPEGKKIYYNASSVFEFPVGTTLIKTFYFPNDFRDESKGRRLIETRLLIREESGWVALPYIWNPEQTDAYLDVAGDSREIKYIDRSGARHKQTYFIPNMNQCKGCHNQSERMIPIGPTAGQLNADHDYGMVKENQLIHWKKAGMLSGLPDLQEVPKFAIWDDPSSGSLEQRARIWLDVNCAHCHNPEGPAATSGLNLGIAEKDPVKWGVYKTPVAAGRGSGNLLFDIVPHKPEASILIYRMNSKDPGIMMPETGRTVLHKEGIELVSEWIRQMK